MSTMAGLTLAAIAAALALEEPVPGVTGVIGVVGVIGAGVCVVDCAIWCVLTARARLHPIPAPAAAATTAIRTTYAAIRLQTEVGGGGWGGAQLGGGPIGA